MFNPILSVSNEFVLLPSYCNECKKSLPPELVKKCSRCKSAIYCTPECQKKNWPEHKQICKPNNPEKIGTTGRKILQNNDNKLTQTLFQSMENGLIRDNFSIAGKHHITKTREMILEGCSHLNPETSVITIFGAQFFDKGFTEPLPELLKKCKKMILVDIDPITLQHLKQRLNDPKVTTIQTDLTGSQEKIQDFAKEALIKKWGPELSIKNFISILKEIEKEKKKKKFPEALEEAKNSDYVISSLVASVLGSGLKETFFYHWRQSFQEDPIKILLKENRDLIVELNGVFKVLNYGLIYNYIRTIKKCSSSSGSIYYADTTKCSETVLIDDEFSELLRQYLERDKSQTKTKNWLWNNSKDIYTVKSFLFSNSK